MENERLFLCVIGAVATFTAYTIGLFIGYEKGKKDQSK